MSDAAIDSEILRALVRAGLADYFWVEDHRMGLETGIDITSEQAARVRSLVAELKPEVDEEDRRWLAGECS